MSSIKDITILYPLCPSHSGSTLFSLMIGAQPSIFNAGELFLFSDRPIHLVQKVEENCSCNNRKKEDCDFWSKVDEYLALNHKLNLNQLNVESQNDNEMKRQNEYLFQGIARISNCNIIVDSSKVVSRYIQLKNAGFNIIPILFRRNPCATVYSWTKRGHDWWQVGKYYADYYQEVAKEIPDREHLKITYEKFINEPKAYLQKLLSYLGLDSSFTVLEWSLSDTHILKGNAVKFQKDSKLKVSNAWKSKLTTWQKIVINLKAFPCILDRYWMYLFWPRFLRIFIWKK